MSSRESRVTGQKCDPLSSLMHRQAAAVDGTDGGTGGLTDSRPLRKPCTAYQAGSVNNPAERQHTPV